MRYMTDAESHERTIEALKALAAACQRFADETQKAVETFHASADARELARSVSGSGQTGDQP